MQIKINAKIIELEREGKTIAWTEADDADYYICDISDVGGSMPYLKVINAYDETSVYPLDYWNLKIIGHNTGGKEH